jgi:tetratricopeptide (TPR) repeat protein
MEVDRRPEPPKNDLEMLLRVKGPEFFQKHAANVVLGIVLIAAVIYFIMQRRKAQESEIQATNQNTAIAYNYAVQLRDLAARPDLSEEAARQRQELATLVFSAADLVINSQSDAAQKAAAQLSKAEALWALASVPPDALASTQPVAGFIPRETSAYLEDAKAAYTEILSKYPDQKEIVANALLSLGTIAESSSKFDEARQWYEKAIADTSLRPIYGEIAKGRVERLADLSTPFTLATPTSQPATQPSVTPPGTQPATQPAGTP